MNKTVNKLQKLFFIDSEDRDSGSQTSFSYRVNMPQRNAFNIGSIQNAEFDKTYYPISSAESLYSYSGNDGVDDIDEVDEVLTTISERFLTLQELVVLLDTAFDPIFSFVLDDDGKISITNEGVGVATLKFTPKLWSYLGFPPDTDTLNFGVSETVDGIFVGNLERYKVLFLRCDQIKNNDDNILCEFYPSRFSGLVTYTPPDTTSNSVSVIDSTTDRLTFSLTDSKGKEVNLNGGGIRFTLTLSND